MPYTVNPLTNRKVKVGSATFQKILSMGYQYHQESNTLMKPEEIAKITAESLETDESAPEVAVSYSIIDVLPEFGKVEQIIHASDIHIPIHLYGKREKEYRQTLDKAIQQWKADCANKKSLIVITGDLIHVKLTMEPETVLVAKEFLLKASEVAPVVLIMGNHDCNEKNIERMDTLVALCYGLSPNIHYLRDSGLYRFGNLVFGVSSLIDKQFIRRQEVVIPDKYKAYKLYHGSVAGARRFDGKVAEEILGDSTRFRKLSDFTGWEAVLLGDEHKWQCLKPNIAYAGSLIQRNFGEPYNQHGYLIWDVGADRCRFVEVDSDYGMINLSISRGVIVNDSLLDEVKRLKYLGIKLKYDSSETVSTIKTIKNQLRQRLVMSEIYFVEQINSLTGTVDESGEDSVVQDVDELEVIQELCNKEMIEDVLKLHQEISSRNTVARNYTTWNVDRVEFKNMFVYGNNQTNVIDFKTGVYNICAPNTAGKSTIANIIMFALFKKYYSSSNNISNVLNNSARTGYVKVWFTSNGQKYLIERHGSYRKSRGKDMNTWNSSLHRIDSQLGCINLTGTTDIDTQKTIETLVGNIDNYSAHYVIDNKHNRSVLTMKDTERGQHFLNICDTSQYEVYRRQAMDEKKKLTARLNQLIGSTQQLENLINGVNQEEMMEQLAELEKEKESVRLELEKEKKSVEQTMESIKDLSVRQAELRSQLVEMELPELSLEECCQQLSQLETEMSQVSDEVLEYIEGESCQSITKQLEQTRLEYDHSYHQLELGYLKEQFNMVEKDYQFYLSCKPKKSEEWLLGEVGKLKTECRILKEEIDSLPVDDELLKELGINDKVSDNVIREKLLSDSIKLESIPAPRKYTEKDDDWLVAQSQKYSEIIGSGTGMEKLNRDQLLTELTTHENDYQKYQTMIDELLKKYPELDDELNELDELDDELDNELNDLSIEELAGQVRPLLAIPEKHPITVGVEYLEGLILKANKLRDDYRQMTPSRQEMAEILMTEVIDEGDYIKLAKGVYQQLLGFVSIEVDDIYQQIDRLTQTILDLSQQKQRVEEQLAHNSRVDNLIKENQMIEEMNGRLEREIARNQLRVWRAKCFFLEGEINKSRGLLNQYDQWQEAHQRLTDIEYERNRRQLLEKKRVTEVLNRVLLSREHLKKSCLIGEHQNTLGWYSEYNQCCQKYEELKKKIAGVQKNQEVRTRELFLKECLRVVGLRQKITEFNDWVVKWKQIESNQDLRQQLEMVNQELELFQISLEGLRTQISQTESKLVELNRQSSMVSATIENLEKYQEQLTAETVEQKEIDHRLKVLVEYKRLMEKGGVPFHLLQQKMSRFDELVNEIFGKHTKYTFSHLLDKVKNRMEIVIHHRSEKGRDINHLDLSGYETIVLKIAINRAITAISNVSRSGLLIIDEALDCIDSSRFQEVLPRLINTMRRYYTTTVIISHRNIDDSLFDYTLNIVQHRGSSSSCSSYSTVS